ncbi:unnamed protein product [Polarella glacialis]|uniref:Leucine-rich repeat-containing protein 47 n=1 Tax=Polarella glacialis TaxID=89957 RepID=A0A813HDL4_POLGL|nr:unnamed protein product [Polarella glacialis]
MSAAAIGGSLRWPELCDLNDAATSLRIELAKDGELRQLVDPKLWRFTALTSLDLSGLGLTRLDDLTEADGEKEVEDAEASLTCSGQKAADTGPSGLRCLAKLRDLVLCRNRLGPELKPDGALHGLSALRSLDLEGNGLESLPAALVSLPALNSLNVGRNLLTELPWLILALLPELRSVAAHNNRLNSLTGAGESANSAATDGGMETTFPPRLTDIILCGNQLAGDGELAVLGKIGSLTSLDVSENQLTCLPSELSTGGAKLQRLAISGNIWLDKKLSKLAELQADQGQVSAKPVLELLRKGQSMRQLKAERGRASDRPTEMAPRMYGEVQLKPEVFAPHARETAQPKKGAKAKAGKAGKASKASVPAADAGAAVARRKRIMISRDALGVRPYVVAMVLHVVIDDGKEVRADKPFVFCAEGADGLSPSSFAERFEANLGLLEQGLTLPAIDDDAAVQATRKAVSRLQVFIAAQTRIHASGDLGNKRRAGTLGSHNMESIYWPLHFKALPHESVKFSPLAIGWMQSKGVVNAAAFAQEAAKGHIAGASKEVSLALQRPAKDLLAMPLCPHLVDDHGLVLSVHPLSNGWQTRTTEDARGSLLLECSSAQSEAICRRMLIALIKDAIELIEGPHSELPDQGFKVRVLVEPVEVVCEWDQGQRRALFPSHEEMLSLPAFSDGCKSVKISLSRPRSDSRSSSSSSGSSSSGSSSADSDGYK